MSLPAENLPPDLSINPVSYIVNSILELSKFKFLDVKLRVGVCSFTTPSAPSGSPASLAFPIIDSVSFVFVLGFVHPIVKDARDEILDADATMTSYESLFLFFFHLCVIHLRPFQIRVICGGDSRNSITNARRLNRTATSPPIHEIH